MRPIDADALKMHILEERKKIPVTIPTAYYELVKEKPNTHGNSMRGGIRIALRCMEETPTLTLDDIVPHGRWKTLNHEKDYLGFDIDGDFCWFSDNPVICTVCHYDLNEHQIPQTPHCPNCGAKMDLEEDDGTQI